MDRGDIAAAVARKMRELAEDGDMEAVQNLRAALTGATIVAIHSHKVGHGDGVWFRLADGRVINAWGEQSPADAVYDSVAN